MGQAPDELNRTDDPAAEIEREIAGTRSSLTADVDELADRLKPKNVANRQVDKVKAQASGLRDRVMGSAQDAADSVRGTVSDKVGSVQDKMGSAHDKLGSAQGSVHGAAGDVKGAASDLSQRAGTAAADTQATVTAKTRGNPLAAGLIAFGAGWLVSSLIPASAKEARATALAVDRAKEHGGGVIGAAQDAVLDVRENLTASAKDAAQSVAQTAKDGAQQVKSDAQGAAGEVADHGKHAAADVQQTARS